MLRSVAQKQQTAVLWQRIRAVVNIICEALLSIFPQEAFLPVPVDTASGKRLVPGWRRDQHQTAEARRAAEILQGRAMYKIMSGRRDYRRRAASGPTSSARSARRADHGAALVLP
jgi:hypothetical protein